MNKFVGCGLALAAMAGAIWLWPGSIPENPDRAMFERSGGAVADRTSGDASPPVSAELPPQPAGNSAPYKPRQQLWQDQVVAEGEEEGIPVTYLQADPAALEGIAVGQTLDLPLPDLNRTFHATLHSTHNQYGGVHVWNGQVEGGLESENVIVTRGQYQTVVMISTREGAYTVRIDNDTGKAALTNETHANPGLGNHEDYVLPPELPEPPLPQPGA